MATKPKTPTLQIADAVAQLAAGATLEDVAPPVSLEADPAPDETPPAPEPEPVAGAPREAPPVSQEAPAPDPLLDHFKQEAVELGKQNRELSIKLALMGNELAQAQAQATAHADLLGGLTRAACAAVNIRHIQLGRRSADLTHLSPQAALAEFNSVHDEFLAAFSAGQHADSRQSEPTGQRIPSGDTVRRMTALK